MEIKKALISVSDKKDLDILVKKLKEKNIKIIATGNTANFINTFGIETISIEDITKFPEILNGRVKTLHPNIFGGILERKDNKKDIETLSELNISSIDLIVVNFYPFEKMLKKMINEKEILEYIDIGGPSLARAAAKNYYNKIILTDPEQYPEFIENIDNLSLELRKKYAKKVFHLTSFYDSIIARSMEDEMFPDNIDISLKKDKQLTYGENPHQKAYFYKDSLLPISLLEKNPNLSYNNILDTEAALKCVKAFTEPTAVIIKHQTICGLASKTTLALAFERAYSTDPMSAFGGIVGVNKEIDEETALNIHKKKFINVIIAPKAKPQIMKILTKKKNRKIIIDENLFSLSTLTKKKEVIGGFLIQQQDSFENPDTWEVVTEKKPDEKILNDLYFSQCAISFVKSNSIILAKDKQLVGIGGGNVSRIDALITACRKAGEKADGAVMASDALIPFPDSIEYAAKNKIIAIVQPGGAKKDNEIIEKANSLGLIMLFSKRRHFLH